MTERLDLLLRNIDWLITVDSGRRIIRDAAIGVKDGCIAAIGKTADLAKSCTAAKDLDCSGMVVTPGFVDAHLHSSFHLSRGLADEANAQSFLFDRMYPTKQRWRRTMLGFPRLSRRRNCCVTG